MKFKALVPAICLAALTSQAHAAGFAIQEQSVKGLGAAFAGGAASAEDATTIFFNPAGMARLEGNHASVGIHYIMPQSDWEDAGSVVDPTAALFGVTAGTNNGGDGGNDVAVPSVYAMYSYNDTIKFGLGVNAPFGLVTEYDSGWIGRYGGLRSDLKTLNINPSIALRFSDHWSAGFGISFQRVEVELTNLVFGGAAGANIHSKLTGQGWSLGFNGGLLYEYDENTRIGIHYRSHVRHEINGTAEITNTAAASTVNASAEIDLPETVSLSAYHRLNPRWGVMADLTWTHWARFNQLRVNFTPGILGGGVTSSITPEQWENSLRYSLGTDYRWNDRLTLRAGVSYDETPIPSAQLRTPRIAGEDRIWLAVGGTWNWSETISFDLGYTHLFVDDGDIDWTTGPHSTAVAAGGTDPIKLKGSFDNSVDIVSVQANFKF